MPTGVPRHSTTATDAREQRWEPRSPFIGWKMHLASYIWRKDTTLGMTRVMTLQRTTVQPTSESGELANRKEALRKEQASPRGPDDQEGNMKSEGLTYQTTSEH